MRSYIAVGVGLLAMISLIGATLADMTTVQEETRAPDPFADEAGEAAAELVEPAEEEPLAEGVVEVDRQGRGIVLRPNGTVTGRVNYINRNTLELVPVPDAHVTFMQQRRVVAQGITGEDGNFEVRGLSPWAVYSVFVSSKEWVSMATVVIRPLDRMSEQEDRILEEPVEAAPQDASAAINEFRLVSTNLTVLQDEADEEGETEDEPADDEADGEPADGDNEDDAADEDDAEGPAFLEKELLELQVLPREDFIAALRQGLFGPGVFGPGGLPAGGLGPSGGGGGAGGGGGLGAGAALGAIGAGLGAAAIAHGDDDKELATPFAP